MEEGQKFLKPKEKSRESRRACIRTAIVIGGLLVFIIVVVILVCLSWPRKEVSATSHYRTAAVASDATQCSSIGRQILQDKNGSSVDATIATLLCLGVHSTMSAGIGGGFMMVVHDVPRNGSKKIAQVFDAREVAPQAATKDMFDNGTSSSYGGKAIAVPGEIRGYHEAWKQFGRLPWSDLFDPTIELCKSGFKVPWAFAAYIKQMESIIRNTTGLREILVKPDGTLYKEGDLMKRPRLAATLQRIRDNPDDMYSGSLAKDVVDDVKDIDGIITEQDLQNYKVTSKLLTMDLNVRNYRLHTLRPPSSGVLFGFMLRILSGFNLTANDIDGTHRTVETYHKLAETFKFGYAMRSYLGDEDFVNITKIMANLTAPGFTDYIRSRITFDRTHNVSYYHPEFSINTDHGTTHLSVIAPNGGAVSVTSTINSVFGSKMVGKRTGILFNDEMGDFVSPAQAMRHGNENYIEPGKRPMSSMCPGIIVDKNDNVILIIGAAGGMRITSAATYVTTHNLWLGRKINKAVDVLRLHHQLEPNNLLYENFFPQVVIQGLAGKGHVVVKKGTDSPPSVIQAIESSCHEKDHPAECITAVCDYRKRGKPDGF